MPFKSGMLSGKVVVPTYLKVLDDLLRNFKEYKNLRRISSFKVHLFLLLPVLKFSSLMLDEESLMIIMMIILSI